ncbi:MAG: endonuclease Q family protein [candidate division WOR-3 bacterium]|nr:endonuclease Q family protein [candidate division WOR-3 bacterium]MDW7987312.1 endonuclease Q family protein [candidate division WOR-3 bacterium]
MEIIADFHIHSKFSRATSSDMVIANIAQAAQEKGIKIVATGDFTHPKWLAMLKSELNEAEGGLYKYTDTYFILTTEVSNVYFKEGKLRRIHNIIFSPNFKEVEKINSFLSKYGSLNADGRPTLTLDAKKMLEGILEISPDSFIVPSHIWTPWFSIFGSKSGFDSIEECFGELSKQIFALETGLSSDPPMNWLLSSLDHYTLISNSDAHSPSRIGREANVFSTMLNFYEIKEVLRTKDRGKFLYTIEFFPEEGKYHWDGHRNCNVVMSPDEAMANDDLCPVCGKPLTIGVAHRVLLLSDRPKGFIPENAIPYKSLVPLEEIIAEVIGTSRDTLGVRNIYLRLVREFKGEFNVLLHADLEDIKKYSNEQIAKAIELMRAGKINVKPGYDGVFGKISILGNSKQGIDEFSNKKTGQLPLF